MHNSWMMKVDAGDSGDDKAFAALQGLRAAVAKDLHAGALRLPGVARLRRAGSRPALVLAHALYEGAGREAELTRRTDPVHPLFYPVAVDALGA